MATPYEILSISPNASHDEIRQAYLDQVPIISLQLTLTLSLLNLLSFLLLVLGLNRLVNFILLNNLNLNFIQLFIKLNSGERLKLILSSLTVRASFRSLKKKTPPMDTQLSKRSVLRIHFQFSLKTTDS